jgi:hypothetical protein
VALGQGAVSTASFFYEAYQEPRKLVRTARKAKAVIERIAADPDVLVEAIKSLDDPVKAAQRIQNPFDDLDRQRQRELNRTFRNGWFPGYIAGIIGTEILLSKGVGFVAGRLADTFTAAETAVDLYRGAQAFIAANTIGVASRLARLGARQLVRSVDEFGEAAYTGLRRGLSPLSGASQYAVVEQVRALPSRVRQRVAAAGTTEQLVGYLARTGDEGAVLLADGGDDLIEAAVSKGLIDRPTITRIRRLQRTESFEHGDMDEIDTQTLLSVLETREASPLFDDDLTASELLDIGERADLSETLGVSRNTAPDGSTRVFRLQVGDADRGFNKVLRKHVRADFIDDEADGFTSFFPTGRTLNIKGKAYELKDTMTQDDVKLIVSRALIRGDASSGTGDRIELDYSLSTQRANEYGIGSVRVVLNDDGDVVTAFPTTGTNRVAWNGQEFLVSDGSGGLSPVSSMSTRVDFDMVAAHG